MTPMFVSAPGLRDGRRIRQSLGSGGSVARFDSPLRQAKIQQLDDTVGRDLDVGRFEIAVDDAGVVGGGERAAPFDVR